MEPTADELLWQFERELDCYLQVRDALRPVALRLIPALGQYLRHRHDSELLVQARALRRMYHDRRERVATCLQACSDAAGAGERLRACTGEAPSRKPNPAATKRWRPARRNSPTSAPSSRPSAGACTASSCSSKSSSSPDTPLR